MRRILSWLFLLGVLMGITVASAQAQAGDWSVWLYTQRTGTMRQIDANGSVLREITLTLPADSTSAGFPDNVAVSHDGNLFAYLAARDTSGVEQIIVYDTGISSIVTRFEFPPDALVSLSAYASPYIFSEMDTQIAFGYGTPQGVWQVLVLDLIANNTFALDSGSPLAISGGTDQTGLEAAVPVVHAYRGGQIDFSLTSLSEALTSTSYTWDTVANTLYRTDAYPTIFGDTLLMTGESVVPVVDEAFPLHADVFYPVNTLRVFDAAQGIVFPFITSGNRIIDSARFAQNGELIAVVLTDERESRQIELYRRDGGLWGSYTFAPTSLWGMFDGFVFTGQSPTDLTATEIYYENTRGSAADGQVTRIYRTPPDEFARIVWTSDNFMIGPVDPPAWAMLAAPQLVGAALSAPLPTPIDDAVFVPPTLAPTLSVATAAAAPAGLAVGADAFVNTTEGDTLRLREGAGRTFAILRELEDGTRVTLIEGPRGGDGLIWWRVRLADGTTGWLVESVDGIATLLPVFAG